MSRRVFVALLAILTPAIGHAQRTDNPHGELRDACSTCHRADRWAPAQIGPGFRHAQGTFPLEGAHARTACLSCHERLDFKETPRACASCHEDVHRGEVGAECGRCHTPRSFVDRAAMALAHEATRFPLRGAHIGAACEDCHTRTAPGQLRFVNRPMACEACHAAQARTVTEPNHQAPGFATNCGACHSVITWTGARFDHNATAFPLVGAHRAVSCDGCHADKVFKGKTTECVGCHQSDYDNTKDPSHSGAGFPTTCATCHNTVAWEGSAFDHATTQFPLTGAHRTASCAGCHGDGVYKGKNMDCVSCHRSDYDATTTPSHTAAGYPTTCGNCHSTTAWLGAPFDHSTTQFPLTGAHLAQACTACHGDGVYDGKSTQCLSCHQADYSATTRPAHAANGIGSACENCHTTSAWPGATYDHSVTSFPLTGAHATQSCAACHADGVYRGKPTDCVACHQSDYSATTAPNHTTAQFPTTCASCHTTNTWQGATFNHDGPYFPIYSGKHQGKWSSCAQCHTSPSNYQVFSCLTCHEHNQTDMDNKHRNRAGYRYDSQACYACHPRGD